jgi:hypothetical protein
MNEKTSGSPFQLRLDCRFDKTVDGNLALPSLNRHFLVQFRREAQVEFSRVGLFGRNPVFASYSTSPK